MTVTVDPRAAWELLLVVAVAIGMTGLLVYDLWRAVMRRRKPSPTDPLWKKILLG